MLKITGALKSYMILTSASTINVHFVGFEFCIKLFIKRNFYIELNAVF